MLFILHTYIIKLCINKTIPTKIITTFLALILTLNDFMFNSKIHFQTEGRAMRTICALTYENIFMTKFEEKHIYPFIKLISILYLRFINGIFII